MNRTLLAVAFAVSAALGCSAKPPRAPQEHTIAIRGMQFDPATLDVHVGDSVVWKNEDIVPHTATALGTFDSHELGSKQQWHYTLTAPGEISYTCTFHPTMRGTIRVH